MADSTPLKRQRPDHSGESAAADDENNKRLKPSYSHIVSFLDEESDETNQDISSLLTSLQDELSSDLAAGNSNSSAVAVTTAVDDYASCSSSSSASNFELKDEEDEKERVIRHLLEASDDELGIPTAADGDDGGVGDFFAAVDSVEGFANWNGLWELEDANANYYTMLQSELFM
ncbi:hypothetical protein LINPERPRIM_LOCUS41698 [Linum perenne]